MGKKSKSQSQSQSQSATESAAPSISLSFLAENASVDNTVASLFEKSVRAIDIIFKL